MKWLNKQGFTLVEIAIVLGLFSLLIIFTQTNISFLDRMVLYTEIEKLQTICRYLQQSALVTNKQQELLFNKDNKSYHFCNHKEVLSSKVSFDFIPGAKGPPSCANKVLKKAITFINNRIIFYPTGIISSGTIYVTDQTKKIMYALSNSVSQISFLRIYKYDGSWYLLS